LNVADVFLADKLAGTLAVPRKTDLVIRSVFDRRVAIVSADSSNLNYPTRLNISQV